MTAKADSLLLEPGAIVSVIEVDATVLGAGFLHFHGYAQTASIWWQGIEYVPWPITVEGFTRTGDQQPVPTITVGNIDGSVTSLCLYYDDLVGAKVTRHRTCVKYLDAVNFPGGVNPTADPAEEFPLEIWYVERKASATAMAVQFELASPLDFMNVALPRRQIIANQCPWKYRSAECSYVGGPVAKADDTPTAISGEDACSHKPSGCVLRFGANNQLPYGGFVAAGLTRT